MAALDPEYMTLDYRGQHNGIPWRIASGGSACLGSW
jgi:hypothetical protein